MITPKEFVVEDFIPASNVQAYKSVKAEALTGSVLVDNLILLQFVSLINMQRVLKEKYNMPFFWLRTDPTPADLREVADKHHVLIERGRTLHVYVPLGQEVDDSLLQIDIPDYEISIRFVADCNVRLLKTGLSPLLISSRLADFRPLLVFRRLVMDCTENAGTDMHLVSVYKDEAPAHYIEYRAIESIVRSKFEIDFEMMQQVILAVVNKLTPASVIDVNAFRGVTTEIRDLFGDATTDVRIASNRDDAGFYTVFRIQTVNTTTLKVHELGFPKQDVEIIRQIADRQTGLTLVTGEMRSGKNTTIFAMVNETLAKPLRFVEYSNPIENHMPFPQFNYRGDIDLLKEYMKMAKKQDINIAILNEIPNAEVAFAVRDLVNSAIGVITTTHLNRVWHLPLKLREFFGQDYKTIISQLNACINHKMFKRWSGPNMQKRSLVKEQDDFSMFCYTAGVRQYFVPEDMSQVTFSCQPLIEVMVFTDAMKTAMLNFDEVWRAEQMLESHIRQSHSTLENKVAEYVNAGIMSLDEMRRLR